MPRILLIDDNANDRILAIRELRREFSDLQVEEIREQTGFNRALAAGNFDLTITDYQLRWSDGISLLRILKARYLDRPVIMFTNTGTQETAIEAMKAGLDDYVLKSPKHYIRLPVAVKSALERAQSEQRAIHVENRLQFLLNRLDLGVFQANQSGELLEGNAAFLRLLQVNSLPEAQEIYLKQLYTRREINSPRLEWGRQLQLRRKDDSQIWVLLSETLSTNNSDEEAVIDGLLEDISDRVSAQIQLRQLNENLERHVRERTAQLEEANQDLEAFSYSVSHDLREPLRAIQGFAEALLEDYGTQLAASGHEYTQRIAAAANRLDNLIQDLLTYSRLSRADLQRSRVQLSTVVTEALTQLEVEIQERQAQVIVEEPLLAVTGDFTILVQVVTNLLANAIKFAAPGVMPQVRIWAEEVKGQGDKGDKGDNYQLPITNYQSKIQNPKSKIRLWVEDNGIGIDKKYQSRIFRVFERLHGVESYPGTGIGLALVHKGIERMGGQVGLESQLGQGSRFWIQLPKAIDE